MTDRLSRPLLLGLVLALAVLAGCDEEPSDAPATDVDEAAFEASFATDPECFGVEPVGLDEQAVTCGTVEVPADHDDPEAGTLDLAVAAFAGSDRDDHDPLLLLGGGPGQVMVESHLTMPQLRQMAQVGPDLVVIDQRGVGASEPALDCPELPEVEAQDSVAEDVDAALAALAECRERLGDEVGDLAPFNHLANARDVDLVREALGLEQLNVRGGSYGSQVALLAGEMFPETVRSVTLSSPLDPRENWVEGTGAGLEQALDEVAERCAADEACAEELGDVHEVVDDVVRRLEAEPEEVTVQPPGGEEVTSTYGPGQFVGGLFLLFYDADLVSLLPAVLGPAREGDLGPLAWIAAVLEEQLEDMVSVGMQFSMLCSGEGGLASTDAALADVDTDLIREHWYPSAVVGGEPTGRACELWDVPQQYVPADVELGADVPTLIVTGALDHVTPPQLGEQVHEALPSSHLVEVAGAAHSPLESISVSTCGREIQQEFLVDPAAAPDTDCVDDEELQLRTTLPPGFGGP